MERKTEWIKLRVTSSEKKFITEKAKNANMNVSEFLINSVQRKRIVAKADDVVPSVQCGL